MKDTGSGECFHCGLPADKAFSAIIDGEQKEFCCLGCQLVSLAIIDGGLEKFYEFRDAQSTTPDSSHTSFLSYDLPEIQQDFVESISPNTKQAKLSISNISCAACAWLIENYLMKVKGVQRVSVNASAHICLVEWSSTDIQLSEIFHALQKIGYQAHPHTASLVADVRRKEEKSALLRLGVAGLGMMQVGMVAIALHAGNIQGIDTHWQQFLRWISLLVATPVMFFSARPFFINAWRALKLRTLNMDVPVSLALTLAFTASIWATLTATGEVYFDSVSMFTFFLLAGRFLEMRVRHSSAFETERLSQLLPLTVEVLDDDNPQQRSMIPLKAMKVGQSLWVNAGDTFPCDGVVLTGTSSADESLLTGESLPQGKEKNSVVLAGTVNGESALTIRALRIGSDTQLANVENLVDKAVSLKPNIVAIADRYSSVFVGVVLLVAIGVAGVWWWIDPSKAFWVSLSVLVVTCPCALSLATPTALTAGTLRLRQLGVLISNAQFLEKLADVDTCVCDKTGTLTKGKLHIAEVRLLSETMTELNVLSVIRLLEENSKHPIASAFHSIKKNNAIVLHDIRVHASDGVEGRTEVVINGETHHHIHRFGKMAFALGKSTQTLVYPGEGLWQLYTRDNEPLAWIRLEDSARLGIHETINELSQEGVSLALLSGDRKDNVQRFAETHAIERYQGEATPADKLAYIQALQAENKRVLMVGDGINDVPVLSGADMSIAMGNATRLAQTHADAIMLNDNLLTLPHAIRIAKTIRKVIWQNLGWAVLYNVVALPLAVMGLIPPYLAAIGMSLSSLIVVLNAWRLRRIENK